MNSSVALAAAVLFVTSSAAIAGTLQIDSATAPFWDPNSTTQTGLVDGSRVEATSTDSPRWNPTFNDNGSFFSSPTLFGPLAQPAGSTGDAFNNQIASGDAFDVTIKFLDPIVDPIFYIVDIDLVGGSVTFDPGWDSIFVSEDGKLTGNTISSTSGVVQDTTGAFAALQYLGDYASGSTFTFVWDFSNVSGGENVAIGLGTIDESEPPLDVIPIPASLPLLLSGILSVLGVRLASRRRL